MNDLKPCPFCGGKALLQHCEVGAGYSYIVCQRCEVTTPQFFRAFDRACDIDAINFWNRRATDG